MILVDTGPLVALCDPRDGRHATAIRDLRALSRERLFTCEAVLVEANFHLPHAMQRRRLRALLDELELTPLLTHGRVFQDEVFDWLERYAEHEPDWADACLVVLSARDRRFRLWTYDQEFRTVWRRPDRTAIPLAVRR